MGTRTSTSDDRRVVLVLLHPRSRRAHVLSLVLLTPGVEVVDHAHLLHFTEGLVLWSLVLMIVELLLLQRGLLPRGELLARIERALLEVLLVLRLLIENIARIILGVP